MPPPRPRAYLSSSLLSPGHVFVPNLILDVFHSSGRNKENKRKKRPESKEHISQARPSFLFFGPGLIFLFLKSFRILTAKQFPKNKRLDPERLEQEVPALNPDKSSFGRTSAFIKRPNWYLVPKTAGSGGRFSVSYIFSSS